MLVPTTCFNCESACGLLAYVDKDDLSVKKVEGNPAHPGSRGRNCAKGPATINQVNDPERILHPLRRTGERGGGQWEQVSWDDRPRRHRGPDPDRDQGGPQRGGRLPRRPARARTGSPSGCCRPGACDGHNSHTQRLLVRRPARPDPLGRLRPALPGPRQRQGDPAVLLAPGDRALLQPARPADHGGQAGRRQARRRRPADVQHRLARRPVARPVAGQRGGDAAGDRLLPAAHPADRRALPAPLVQLGRLPARTAPRGRADVRGLPRPRSRPTTPTTRSSSPPRSPRFRSRSSRSSPNWSPSATAGSPRTSGARRPRATSAAGRSPARCGSSWR